MNWLTALDTLAASGTPAVLVTVAAVAGSVPREPGAKMVVTAATQFDTIGGGHLELRACEVARSMLAAAHAPSHVERFPLGASLGQCCGGVVHLAFERVTLEAYARYQSLAERSRERRDTWRLLPLNGTDPALLCDVERQPLIDSDAVIPSFDPAAPCQLLDDGHQQWLIDPIRADRPQLVLFGAGHVGAALVRALADLPCHVTWVDEREHLFPAVVPANVRIEVTDTPDAVVDEAPAGTCFLVMTHSHALDQQLSETILRRDDAGWFGLIGSKTKRMQFEHRLRERGITRERLAHMTCPIGLPGIHGKEPAVIAASVCAQLLMVWEQQRLAAGAPALP